VRGTDAFARLGALGVPVFETGDAAAALGCTTDAAHKTLSRLVAAGLLVSIKARIWGLPGRIDRLALVEHLSRPWPGYVSLQTALFVHGMISQIPVVTFAVTSGRTRRIRTSLGTYSLHRIGPDFFGDWEMNDAGAKIARPEKALLDVFYLSPSSTRLFASLPEVELPHGFDVRWARARAASIASARLRTLVTRRLDATLARGRPQRGATVSARSRPYHS
jgi:hypothetical protein